MKNLFTFSQAGGHTANEDACLTLSHPDDDSILICALADGQGGRLGGQAAAQRACAAAVETASTYAPKQLTRTKTWSKTLGETDRATHDLPAAGATTLVALCITARVVCGASSGDSAAVLLNVYDQYHELTSGQTKNPPVGSGQAQFTPFCEQLIDPWRILLMSDGLWKYVGWRSVTTMIKRHHGAALIDALAAAARSADSGVYRDDTTIILIESDFD